MLEHHWRNFYQKIFVDPLAGFLQHKISAQTLTLIGCALGVLVWPLLALKLTFLSCVFLILSGYLDTLDGTVARLQGKTSAFGSMLDIVCDRIVEFAVILGLFSYFPVISRAWCGLFMLGSILICITTFLVVGIFSENTSQKGFHYSPGIIERAEAFIFFLLMIILPSWFLSLAIIFTGLVFLTAAIRMYQFYKLKLV